MLARQVLHGLFSRVNDESFAVEYWDGTRETYGGATPRFTVMIRDDKVLDLLCGGIELGFADAYIGGRIEIEGDVADVVALANRNSSLEQGWISQRFMGAVSHIARRRSLKRQKEDIARHYDIGNDFFRLWLDESMTYSCAYFKTPDDTLEQAQQQKVEHSLRKLRLKPGETLLDIGCGWGSVIIRAAEEYGVRATGITLSEEQARAANESICARGLEGRVDVRLMNYAEMARTGQVFDKVISIGMIEHVGKAHLAEFARDVHKMLKMGGLAMLHHITGPGRTPDSQVPEGFVQRIFPGGYIPTLTETLGHLEALDFHVQDVENLRHHYRMTLDRWSERYERNLEAVRAMFDEEFVRMWRLYLRGCSAGFRVGSIAIHQMLVSKGPAEGLPLTRADLYA